MPACFAAMVHVPTATSVTVEADTVQMVAVVELKATAKPDEAVAETVNVPVPKVLPVKAAKVMVCVPLLMTTF